MKNLNTKGYAAILTIITIGILGIIIFGLLNLHSLNHKMIQSNESSIKAYYLGESGIAVLKKEIDNFFEKHSNGYLEYLKPKEEPETPETDEKVHNIEIIQTFKDYVMMQDGFMYLQEIRTQENVFLFYTEPHGWRLQADFEESITLYATGHYKDARKRVVAIISYPDVLSLSMDNGTEEYRFVPSVISAYYQGYEGEHID